MMNLDKLAVLLILCWAGFTTAQNTVPVNGSVRLQGIINVESAGRVEVYINGVWGTVCSITATGQWSLKNAQVVCRQLGYATAITALPQRSLVVGIRAGDSVPFHLAGVQCDGTETQLRDCPHSMDTSTCTHFADAAVVCGATEAAVAPGDVRLLGDVADYRGAVEYYDEFFRWTGVCADSARAGGWLSSRAAGIVCSQLGYEGGRAFVQRVDDSVTDLSVGNLDCRDDVTMISDCDSEFSGGCTSQMAGWVECSETSEDDFSIRLVGGDREGILEVAINGRWGTVCEDEFWFTTNAAVACDELGLDSESVATTTPVEDYDRYMSRVKPYWLSEVDCLASSSSIEECDYNTVIGYTDCNMASDNSVFNSAEINCAATDSGSGSGGLSGGAIAGIVIGSLVGVGILCTLIRTWGQKKKKAARAAAAQRQAAPILVPSVQRPPSTPAPPPQQPPPPADVVTSIGPVSSPTAQSYSTAQPQAPPELVATAPPSYQAAVSYPAATTTSYQPPYPEKAGAYPEAYPTTSAAYPPPLPLSAPSYGGGPAYPPPPQDAYPPPGFNPAYLPPPAH